MNYQPEIHLFVDVFDVFPARSGCLSIIEPQKRPIISQHPPCRVPFSTSLWAFVGCEHQEVPGNAIMTIMVMLLKVKKNIMVALVNTKNSLGL